MNEVVKAAPAKVVRVRRMPIPGTKAHVVAGIVTVVRTLVSYTGANTVTIDAIAKAHARANGSTMASTEVEVLREDWMEALRTLGYPVVPMTATFIQHNKDDTQPTTAKERRACVAGIGWGAKTEAIYLPRKGDKDVFARIWQESRLSKKDAKKVLRDLRTQGVSDFRMRELQAHAPQTVSLPDSVKVSKTKALPATTEKAVEG